ncbi:guanylate kinase 1 isoform X2 [Cryptomeria japonica]|uniref:guanylate kinase 1 isoform X2 n=1 Tax=Cryptomeria japonica TaxID=3369 RepID=UPI0025ACBD60|nr:guanylate kinase 1 isoform X2 [Cryptomeria japonica]
MYTEGERPRFRHSYKSMETYIHTYRYRCGYIIQGDLQRCIEEDYINILGNGNCPEARSFHSSTAVGKRIYIFGGDKGGILSNDVQIFETSTGKWITPLVLGTRPSPRRGHSAVPLNNDRILILGGSSKPKDNIWFLEVDTSFVKEQRKIQGNEVVAWSKAIIGDTPQPVVISGPSGVGKGTLINKLMKEFPATFGFSVSHTTRAPREKEMAGVHYHFTQHKVMEMEVQEGKFLESANVHGNMYGTSIAAVEAVADAGKRCILDIDVQGARSVRNSTLNALFIFICPPSLEELEKRLRGRGTEKEEDVQKRLRTAKSELEQGRNSNLFDHILVNDDLDACYDNLKDFLGLSNVSFPLGAANGLPDPLVDVEFPYGHSASLVNQKVIVYGGISAEGRGAKTMHVLDVSSLEGGAPGRTRGVKTLAVDEISNPCIWLK